MINFLEGVGEVHVEDLPAQRMKEISAREVTSWGGIVETTVTVTYELLEQTDVDVAHYIAGLVRRNLQEKVDEEEGRRAYEEACRTYGA